MNSTEVSSSAAHNTTNLLAADGLDDCNSSPTPHIDGQDTSKTTDADILTDKTAYQSLLGSCRFLADATHPRLAFIIGSLGCHAHNKSTRHDAALKRILRYFKGVQDRGLRFPHANGQMALEAYSDSDWAQCIDIRCSTTGLSFSSTALLSTTFHQSNRPLPTHPQRLNLSPPTSPPGISPGSESLAAHGMYRSASQLSVSTISLSVRLLTENKLSASAPLPWASTTRDAPISHTPTA
jgi:hypothetical protein